MRTLFQCLFLWLAWNQVDAWNVFGWEMWRGDSPAGPFYIETIVYEPRYQLPIDAAAQAFYLVAAFNGQGRTFARFEDSYSSTGGTIQ